MTQKKDMIDSLFDMADRVVDGAVAVLKDVPEPEGDEDMGSKKVIDVTDQPLLKSGTESPVANKKAPREVSLSIKNVSQRGKGVVIIAETATRELVAITLSGEDWKKVYDAADWLRMVPD